MSAKSTQFWQDFAKDLKDPEFLREYVRESIRISTVDRLVNELDGAREAAGLSKAELARAISTEPAAIRRFFTSGNVNPTLGTLAELAAALGMRATLEPLSPTDRKQVTKPLLEGRAGNIQALAKHLSSMRQLRRSAA